RQSSPSRPTQVASPAPAQVSQPHISTAAAIQTPKAAGSAVTTPPDIRTRSSDAVQALARLVQQPARAAAPAEATPNRSPLRVEVARAAQKAGAPKQPSATQAAPKPPQTEDDFSEQLSKGFSAIMRQNGGSLTLRLQPESLGAMTIRMDLQPGQVA